jgi:hypothetical protein
MTARMARKYVAGRRLPRCWAVFSWRSTALRAEGDMVKRRQHIGTFLHNEMGISLRGISPMCGRSSIYLQKIFFLRSIGISVLDHVIIGDGTSAYFSFADEGLLERS